MAGDGGCVCHGLRLREGGGLGLRSVGRGVDGAFGGAGAEEGGGGGGGGVVGVLHRGVDSGLL